MQNKKSHLTVIQPSALAERLMLCAEKAGGKRALADKAIMSESQLFRYINGDSEMSGAKAVAIAKAAQVDVGWLLTGLGTQDGPKATDPRPPFRAALMEEILKVLTEIFVDFEWRLNPTQRAKYSAYAYMALRREEFLYNKTITVTPERLTEGLWYFGKNTFDELIRIHMEALHHMEMPHLESEALATLHSTYAESIRQGNYQFANSTGGDAIQRWLGLQVSQNTAERLLNLTTMWRLTTPNTKWLDVGCGNGRELEYVSRLNPDIDVYGIEISRAGLAQTAKFEKAGVWPKGHVIEAEATQLPFPNDSMGMVYCRSVVAQLPYFGDMSVPYGMPQALREMERVCAPGGMICVLTPLHVKNALVYRNYIEKDVLVNFFAERGFRIVLERAYYLDNAMEGYRDQFELIVEKPKK